MSLPWVRLDTNIGTHDKILALLAERDGARAFVVYVCSICYAGGHGTDGRISKHVLPMIHGTPKMAELLVNHRLWEYDPEGGGTYLIRNFEQRQQLAEVSEARRNSARKANCMRWHGRSCGCWEKPNDA